MINPGQPQSGTTTPAVNFSMKDDLSNDHLINLSDKKEERSTIKVSKNTDDDNPLMDLVGMGRNSGRDGPAEQVNLDNVATNKNFEDNEGRPVAADSGSITKIPYVEQMNFEEENKDQEPIGNGLGGGDP